MDWATFTRRTDGPKLAWLDGARIPRRNGSSFHAPLLEVPKDRHEAWKILDPVDDVDDCCGKVWETATKLDA